MNFTNINMVSILIFGLLCLWAMYWFYKNYKIKKGKKLLSKSWILANIFLLLSFIILLFTIFQPKWQEIKKDIKAKWVDVMFVLDVSKSMNSVDIRQWNYATTRLDIAKKAIENYVVKHPNNKYWLVIFAGDATSTIPLTTDKDVFLTLLKWVDYRNLTKQWTNFNKALQLAIDRFKKSKWWKVLVFLSDGWDDGDYQGLNFDFPKDIKTFVIGVWTLRWWNIYLWQNDFWEPIYQRYNWQYVVTHLNENNLKKLANDINAKYIRLENTNQLAQIDGYIKNLEKQSIKLKQATEREDLSRYFVILAFVMFVLYLVVQDSRILI